MPTADNGLTFQANLANPFPAGVADPPGASLGPNTFVGRQLDRWENDVNAFQNAQAMRWSVSVQRELPHQWVVEAAYVGNRSYDLAVDTELNPVPRQLPVDEPVARHDDDQLPHDERDQPVQGPAARHQLQRLDGPAPAAAPAVSRSSRTSRAARTTAPASTTRLQGRVEKRFTSGYTLLVVVHVVEVHRAGVAAERHRRRRTRSGRPTPTFRIGWSSAGSTSCPSGAARSGAPTGTARSNAVLGGWSVQAIYQAQSGRPVSTWGNLYFNGDLEQPEGRLQQGEGRPADLRHVGLLLQRRRGADQRRGRPGEAARRHSASAWPRTSATSRPGWRTCASRP